MAKRNKGIIFLLIGYLLLVIAGGWYIYNIMEDKIAGMQSEELLNKLDSAWNETENAPVIMIENDAFCGTVSIEKLGIELPVYDEWSYTRLKSAPCRYTGSIATNDIIIAGHNYKSHFGSLNKLTIGDEVKFKDAYAKVHTYVVCELVTLDGSAVSDMQSRGWDFTLFTCTKGGVQRVTVRCKTK